MYESNLETLCEREPAMALPLLGMDSVPLSPAAEVELLYLFGWDIGAYFSLRGWLRAVETRTLVFLEDDLAAAAAFLSIPEAQEALRDGQVHFALLPKGKERKEALNELVKRFPVKKLDLMASSTYRRFRSRDCRQLRLDLLRHTTLADAIHIDLLQGPLLLRNWLANLTQLPSSFHANQLQGSFAGVPALICGAGPSLERSIDLLRTLENRALLIAGGSTIAALGAQGIAPHFAAAVDPNLEEFRRFQDNLIQEVPLLFSTRLHEKVFHAWNGPTGYARSGLGGIPEIWIDERLGLFGQWLNNGSLPEETVSVTIICVVWALFLGCSPILFNGIDLAYTDRRRYAAGIRAEEGNRGPIYTAADRLLEKRDRQGRPVQSAVRWVMEARALAALAKQYPEVPFFNTTSGGMAIPGIDDLPLAEAVERFCTREWDLRGQVQQAISSAPMPADSAEVVAKSQRELTESLERVVEQLRIQATEPEGSGRAALAEVEMQEEEAYLFLLRELFLRMERVMGRQWATAERSKRYELLLDVATRYLKECRVP